MKQTQQIKPPIPYGSHADGSASLTKLTALQAPIPILLVCVCVCVCVCTPDLGCTGGNNDIAAGTDTDFVVACTPALRLHFLQQDMRRFTAKGLQFVDSFCSWDGGGEKRADLVRRT